MKLFLYRLKKGADSDLAEFELLKNGLIGIYLIEENGDAFIGGYGETAPKIQEASLIEEKEASIDWENQWSCFSPHYKEGLLHIDLAPYGMAKTLLLTPGAGFGDLSHPTTSLMLEMLAPLASGESIVDIGTGSGILALAALLFGARSAIGIDIDPKAVSHAEKNGALNQLFARFSLDLPQNLPPSLFLMNMIVSEQKEFAPKRFNPKAKLWIVSGILLEQKKEYLALTKSWGWEPVLERKKGDWFGGVFEVFKIS